MKVLFIARSDLYVNPGGDTIQFIRTRHGLVKLGVEVRIGDPSDSNIGWADIVHVFNAQTPQISLYATLKAKDFGKIVVLSPIWWDLNHARLAERLAKIGLFSNPITELLVPISKAVMGYLKSDWLWSINRLLREVDILLPNSQEEMSILIKEFGSNLPQHQVVFNAIDRSVFNHGISARKGIICCARIQPTKNQLNLIRAVPEGQPLTLIGKGEAGSLYVKKVKAEAGEKGFTVIDDHLDQIQIANIMRVHKVHALPSFRESPGLSSLEALGCGLNIVVSKKEYCPINTYFLEYKDRHVFDCDPYSVSSILRALERAQNSERSNKNLINEKFEWDYVAKQTLNAYTYIIGKI